MIGIYEYKRDKWTKPFCRAVRNDKCPPHFHSSIELTYVTSGTLTCTINGNKYILGENEFLFSPSYTLHQYETINTTSSSINLIVPLNIIPSYSKIMETSKFKEYHGKLSSDNELLHNIKKIAEIDKNKDGNTIKIKGYIYAVIGILMDVLELEPIKANSHTDFARDVLVYIDENYLQDLSAENVAKKFGYSKSHFLHIFTTNFGFSFAEYINILKCRHAATLLINEKQELINIAMSSGFNNMRSFYRNFKQFFGSTPSEYLDEHKRKLYKAQDM